MTEPVDPDFPEDLIDPSVIISGDVWERLMADPITPEEHALLDAVKRAAPPETIRAPGTFTLTRAPRPDPE